MLLPFYTEADLVNNTAAMKFVANAISDVAAGTFYYLNFCYNLIPIIISVIDF